MARPLKSGIDYFPLDTVLDDKIGLIEAEFGCKGFAVVVKLFQKIYRSEGYYCEWSKEVALMFARNDCPDVGVNAVSEIVQASIRRNIFNEKMFMDFGILTSNGIQKRYLEATKRRTDLKIKECYLLINNAQKNESVNNNSINVNNNSKIVSKNTTNKSKVNKNKVNKIKENNNDNVIVDEVLKYYVNNINPIAKEIEIKKLTSWEDTLDKDLMIEGIKIAIKNNVRKLSYIEAIYNNWVKDGIKTLEQYNASERIREEQKKHNGKSTGSTRSETITGTTEYAGLDDLFS